MRRRWGRVWPRRGELLTCQCGGSNVLIWEPKWKTRASATCLRRSRLLCEPNIANTLNRCVWLHIFPGASGLCPCLSSVSSFFPPPSYPFITSFSSLSNDVCYFPFPLPVFSPLFHFSSPQSNTLAHFSFWLVLLTGFYFSVWDLRWRRIHCFVLRGVKQGWRSDEAFGF